MLVTESKEIFLSVELIEIHGKTPAEEFAYDVGQYNDLKD